VLALGFCRRHYANLKKDDLWRILHEGTKEQRAMSLEVINSIMKRRPSYVYEGNEAQLIAEQEPRDE
jgi:hypothetical protein